MVVHPAAQAGARSCGETLTGPVPRDNSSAMLNAMAQRGNFFLTWLILTVLAFALMMAMSGALFRLYYWRPTFETWRRKSNPAFPKPEMVRREVLLMLKGIYTATFCPALALHLVDPGWSKAYGG